MSIADSFRNHIVMPLTLTGMTMMGAGCKNEVPLPARQPKVAVVAKPESEAPELSKKELHVASQSVSLKAPSLTAPEIEALIKSNVAPSLKPSLTIEELKGKQRTGFTELHKLLDRFEAEQDATIRTQADAKRLFGAPSSRAKLDEIKPVSIPGNLDIQGQMNQAIERLSRVNQKAFEHQCGQLFVLKPIDADAITASLKDHNERYPGAAVEFTLKPVAETENAIVTLEAQVKFPD